MGAFVHLHTHSCFSFLDGGSTPEELVEAAIEEGMDALALTDTNGLYGAVRFWNAAKERGIKPIFGTELRILDDPVASAEGGGRGRSSAQAASRLRCREAVLRQAGPTSHLVLLAADRRGWTSLCRIVSAGQLAGKKEEPRFTLEMVERDRDGLIALTGCAEGAVPRAVRAGDVDGARTELARLAAIFGDDLFVELTDHLGRDDLALCDALADLAAEQGIGTVVTNDVRYARPHGRRLHDLLRCIDLGLTVDEAGDRLAANGERWLKGEQALRDRLGRFEEGFANSRRIADRCDVDLDFGHQRLPGFPVPEGHTAFSYLYDLCQQGAREKYGRITPAVSRQLAHELDVIERAKLAEFFLINWDIVRFCKERGIPAQGRGSAADSIVAYVLDITKVDPIAHDLLFERFLTEDSKTMPDIDIDIATNDREEVLQYVYGKYGERYSAMVCNLVTYRARLASREVAKALGFRAETIDRMARSIDQYAVDPRVRFHDHPGNHPRLAAKPPSPSQGAPPPSTPARDGVGLEEPQALADTLQPLAEAMDQKERERFPLFRELTLAIADLPRHLSIHNGGMLITAAPLVDVVPIERATMPGRNVVQFDKRDIEDLGLVKMDLLGLRTLSLVKDAVAMIADGHGARLELGSLPLDDPAVYDLICEVDTIGLFQVESRAQAQALPRVRPRTFADIVVEVAIIRPGPLQGNAVNPYIRRRQGKEPVSYAHPALEPVLRETLGVILFQEQILRVAMAIAGFSAAEGDKLRRAMSRARSAEDMERLRGPFMAGARASGVEEATASEIFRQIAAFAEFGFCKSHAAAFALTAYHTAHLKLYYPAEFYVALLNDQPMGFYSPAVIAGDAKRHGVRILPVDVNKSFRKAVVEEIAGEEAGAGDEEAGVDGEVPDRSATIARHRICRTHHIRLGFTYVKGLGEKEADAIVAERERGGPFRSFDDLARRAALKEEALRNLALVGGFDAFGERRRALLWRARDAHLTSPSFVRPTLAFSSSAAPVLPELSAAERTALDYRITGVPTGPQVMSYYRDQLVRRGVLNSSELPRQRHGRRVRTAGAIVVKQHPETAKGHVFLSLEDEFGMSNVIVRPATYRRFKSVLDSSAAIVVEGELQNLDGVISVLARRLDALPLFVSLAAREWH